MDISVSSQIFKKNSSKTVVVGMSGGVDSSVAALILKKQGYKVIGLFMKNWEEEDENGVCNASKEYADVIKVCEKLDIPYYSVEFVKEYRDNVFENFLEEYKKGHTPNPDILCNKEIKFKVFFDKAINELNADYLATGHYCQTESINGDCKLIKGIDSNKDQSYFLYTIKSSILEKVLFPIGHIEKSAVRQLAEDFNLATKDKKDSTGICFIGERNFKNFLSQYIEYTPGKFKTLDGKTVGEHSGSAFYTLGQRKGLGLGGEGPRWFVVEKDHSNNIVYVERGDDHPALYSDELFASEISWVSGHQDFETPFKCEAKVRYRQENQKCTIVYTEANKIHVSFDTPQRAITIGQSVVFYTRIDNQEVCLGGAIINELGENYFKSGKNLILP